MIFSFLIGVSFLIRGASGQGKEPNEIPSDRECVILLHGLARTNWSMHKMAGALTAAGYHVNNIDYPSREKTIEQLAGQVIVQGLKQCSFDGMGKIHFVTHSMGGIIVRYYLKNYEVEKLGRVVMLSPPSRGSEVVDELRDTVFFKWFNGPAGQQLGTGPDSLPLQLGPIDYPVGVITGDRHLFFDAHHAALIPGKDDGKVSVERAKLTGMTDFLIVPYAHTFIMDKKQVINETIYFLRHGRFLKKE